jgi:adenylate cyclase
VATDFEAEGLLDGLDGEQRDARRLLLEELEAAGVPLAELRDAVADGRLALLPLERELTPPGPRYTFGQAAERSGLDEQFLAALMRALGLALPQNGEATLTDDDIEAARTVAGFRAVGIPDEPLLEATRVLGHSLSQFVSATRGILGEVFVSEGDTEYDVATRWAQAARELNPQLSSLVQYVLRAQQIAQLRQDVIDLTGMGEGGNVRSVSVAFADLAGFTRLGEQVAASELGSIAGRLTAMATDVAVPPVRLVKMIGDAAMLVSTEPRAALEAVLDLVDAADAQGEEFPQLRAGIACGGALARAGDWFGRPVNLASRLTDRARPGSVVVTSEFKDAVGEDGYSWSQLPGRRRLKGISGEIDLYRVRRAGSE